MIALKFGLLYLGSASLGSLIVFGLGTPFAWRMGVALFAALCLVVGGSIQ